MMRFLTEQQKDYGTMKYFKLSVIVLCIVLGYSTFTFAKTSDIRSQSIVSARTMPKSLKGVKAVPGSFRVKTVTFKKIILNNRVYLAAAIVFNRNIDASSVKENVNIRMLKKNENNFWVDASTQNNIVHVKPYFITWVSGAPLVTGVYKMHLRGTIKSADGALLDGDGDGVGEGGNLPAYNSQLYQAQITELNEIQQ